MIKKVRAKEIKIATIYAVCGKCGEDLTEPLYGSLMIYLDEIVTDKLIECWKCGTINELPKWVWNKI